MNKIKERIRKNPRFSLVMVSDLTLRKFLFLWLSIQHTDRLTYLHIHYTCRLKNRQQTMADRQSDTQTDRRYQLADATITKISKNIKIGSNAEPLKLNNNGAGKNHIKHYYKFSEDGYFFAEFWNLWLLVDNIRLYEKNKSTNKNTKQSNYK